MRVIIAGSRDLLPTNGEIAYALDEAGFEPTEIISGGARGVDHCGENYARIRQLPLRIFKADWDTYGRSAGALRNAKMAENADALLAFWDGKSKGTKNMIDTARHKRLKIYIKGA